MNGVAHRWRIAAGIAAAGLAAVLTIGACSAGSDNAGTNDSGLTGAGDPAQAPAGQPPDAQRDAANPGGQADQANPAPGEKQAEQAPAGAPRQFQLNERSIVYTGGMTVRVEDVDRAAARATEIATGAGGFVGSDKRSVDAARSQATLELRVPAGRFYAVVGDLARLGDEESRGLSSEDVTEAVIDVDARLATQQASVNRTRALLAQARTIAEIVSVEAELSKREAELASLQARKRQLADLSTLSTITVTLLGPDADVVDGPKEDDTGFLAGFRAGWRAFVESVEVLLTIVGALLPWLIALGVPIWVVVWLARWYGRRTVPAPATAPPAAVTIPSVPPPGRPEPPTLPRE